MRRVFTVLEACDYLKLGRRKIFELLQTRKISHRKIGRAVRFTQQDLDEFIESCRIPAVPTRE